MNAKGSKPRSSSEPTQRKDSFKLHTAQITGNHQPSPFLRRFKLPPLSAQASNSYDDVTSPTCDSVGGPDQLLYQNALAWASAQQSTHGRAGHQGCSAQIHQSKQIHAVSGNSLQTSSSDYFSMTDSLYSEADVSEFPRPPSPSKLDQPTKTFADLLKQVEADAADIERRNREINEAFPDP